jgi:hypothetical protein
VAEVCGELYARHAIDEPARIPWIAKVAGPMCLVTYYDSEVRFHVTHSAIEILRFFQRPCIGAGLRVKEDRSGVETLLNLLPQGEKVNGNTATSLLHVAEDLRYP